MTREKKFVSDRISHYRSLGNRWEVVYQQVLRELVCDLGWYNLVSEEIIQKVIYEKWGMKPERYYESVLQIRASVKMTYEETPK